MGGILGACNAISDYLHTLNMGSTLFRLILAMFLGCLIGIDRGMKKRVAGVKTHMIVCMGATLVMMTGDFIHVYSNGAGIGDTARLGAQVVSGIGFLGVGTIIVTGQRHVSGLTTAASLWTSACIGLAVGIGFYSGAIFTTLGLILVFKYAKYIEVYVEEHSNTYDVYMEFENEDKMSMVIKKLRDGSVHDDRGEPGVQSDLGGGELGDHAAGSEGGAPVSRQRPDFLGDGRNPGDSFRIGIIPGIAVVDAVDVA